MSSLKLLNQDAEHAKRFIALAMNINAAKGLQVFTYQFHQMALHDQLSVVGSAQIELGAEGNLENACRWIRRYQVD